MAHFGASLDTPHTENLTDDFLTNSALDLSIEPSFYSPSRGKNGLINPAKGGRKAQSLKTPRTRIPLLDRRNPQPAQVEFTPMLKSAVKNNVARRRGKENGKPETPAALREDMESMVGSPGLPVNSSGIYQNDGTSSFIVDDAAAATPLPPGINSSAMSTPLAMLPKREGGGAPDDGGRVLSLREQEEIVGKIEKENFGLKLKIHFLEDALQRKDPHHSEAALKENTDLKVDKVTLQRELSRFRKMLSVAERDLELYRQQLADAQDQMRKRHADEGQKEELDRLAHLVREKETEIETLKKSSQASDDRDVKAEALQDQIGDLEAEIREKERHIDDRDDQIEELKDKISASADAVADFEDQVATMNRKIRDLESEGAGNDDKEDIILRLEQDLLKANAKIDALETDLLHRQNETEDALAAKAQAETELEDLRDDIANKSFHTKGLNRQLEDKASSLNDDVERLRSECDRAKKELQAKSRELAQTQSKLEDQEHEFELELTTAKDKNELLIHEKDIARREQNSLLTKLRAAEADFEKALEDKQILQSQQDSSSRESHGFQRELAVAQAKVQELEVELENVRDHSSESSPKKSGDLNLEVELKNEEIERLKDELEDQRIAFDENERHFDSKEDEWKDERRTLESKFKRSGEQIAALEQSLARLREAEGAFSGKETKLQKILQAEESRHQKEEDLLKEQIETLNAEISSKRQHLENAHAESSKLRSDLRASKREEDALREKIQGLDDEIEVLQAGQEDEGGFTLRIQDMEAQLSKSRRERQSLQDKVARLNIDITTVRGKLLEAESQRDELQSELRVTQHRAGESTKLDKEKTNLLTSKTRLENEIARLREENKAALSRAEELQLEFDEEVEKAGAEETRLEMEIEELRKQLTTTSESRDKELRTSRRTVQRLEARIEELELQLQKADASSDSYSELEVLRNDLSAARKKEADYAKREAAQKENVRDLRRRMVDLERIAHETEIKKIAATPASPQTSSVASAELAKARAQLQDAHKELRTIKIEMRNIEQEQDDKARVHEHDLLSRLRSVQAERDDLQNQLKALQAAEDQSRDMSMMAESTIQQLRQQTSRLERDLRNARSSAADMTIIRERKDLHHMLREAKLEVEDLRARLQAAQDAVDSSEALEMDLRAQLKRIRNERSQQSEQAIAAVQELDSVQRRYERTLDKMVELQKALEAERTALARGISAVNEAGANFQISIGPSVDANGETLEDKENRHAAEMNGMIKQIGYLKARFQREQGFRLGLVLEKWYMQQQIKQYDYYNKVDIKMLREMGIKHEPKSRRDKTKKLRSLRSVGLVILAVCRMQKKQRDWKVHQQTKEELTRIAADLGLTKSSSSATVKNSASKHDSPRSQASGSHVIFGMLNPKGMGAAGGVSPASGPSRKGKERVQPAAASKGIFAF